MRKQTKTIPEIYPKIITWIVLFAMTVGLASIATLCYCTIFSEHNIALIDFWIWMAIASWSFLIGDVFGMVTKKR